MRTLVLTVAWLLVTIPAQAEKSKTAPNQLTPEEKAAGFRLLFNGKDYTGWRCNNGKPVASAVEDGSLVPYKSGGYLVIYEKPFADFVLRCDVKMSPHCNSGIFFRVADPKDPVQTGFEVQIMNSRGKGMHDFGAIYDLVPPSENNIDPDGWNSVEITCRGPHISVAVNGKTVAKMNCDEWTEVGKRPDGSRHKFSKHGKPIRDFAREGYIGFQDHGHKVWFRNIRIRELK